MLIVLGQLKVNYIQKFSIPTNLHLNTLKGDRKIKKKWNQFLLFSFFFTKLASLSFHPVNIPAFSVPFVFI